MEADPRRFTPRQIAGLLSRRTTVRALAGGMGFAALASTDVDAKKKKGKPKRRSG